MTVSRLKNKLEQYNKKWYILNESSASISSQVFEYLLLSWSILCAGLQNPASNDDLGSFYTISCWLPVKQASVSCLWPVIVVWNIFSTCIDFCAMTTETRVWQPKIYVCQDTCIHAPHSSTSYLLLMHINTWPVFPLFEGLAVPFLIHVTTIFCVTDL